MNKEEFDRAMEGADLIEQRRLRREMDDQEKQLDATPGTRAIGPLGGILATLAAAAVLPAFGHTLWLIGVWSWNLIG